MKLVPHTTKPRRGFTMIELLIVIGIIALLVSLTAAAVFRLAFKGPELVNRNDVAQLANALEAFKTQYGFYPPSRIHLCYYQTMYGNVAANTQIDADSQTFLLHMFPRCSAAWSNPNQGIAWLPTWPTPSGGPLNNPPDAFLEGEDCLMFFLGGVQVLGSTPGVLGFCSTPTDPMNPNGSSRIGPFYEFNSHSSRLSVDTAVRCNTLQGVNNTSNIPSQCLLFQDTYGTPFAYFSSYKTRNGYNRYFASTSAPATSDCQRLLVWPYQDFNSRDPNATAPNVAGPETYFNPTSFQLISAGYDKAFGQGTAPDMSGSPYPGPIWTGTLWDQVNCINSQALAPYKPGGVYRASIRAGDPGNVYTAGVLPGADDISNFHTRFLGVPLE